MAEKQPRIQMVSALFLLLALPAFLWTSPSPGTPPPEPTPTAKSWIILPTYPPDTPQADVGAEIYRLVCSACHGDRGQGFTPDWVHTWDPSDQNCWQSHCHGPNHPDDGFELPHYMPPVAGARALRHIQTALDLYTYIYEEMPWYAPKTLQTIQAWQVTAFVLRLNQIELKAPLDETNAAAVLIHPATALETPSPSTAPLSGPPGAQPAGPPGTRAASKPAFPWLWVGGGALLLGAAVLLGLRRRGPRS